MAFRKKSSKYISEAQALKKLQRYCAYQDRCHQEVRSKLIDLGVYGDVLERVIADLITDNFLNEERFAKSYAGGKFRVKKWGRVRILRELKLRKISPYCIKKAMLEIPDVDYQETLSLLIEKKNRAIEETNLFKRRAKIAQYLLYKGYESPIIWKTLKEKIQ